MIAAARLLRYAKDLLGTLSPQEILLRTCREVLVTSGGNRVWGVLHPGQRWEDALVAVVEPEAREVTAAERSAMFALFRRIVGKRGTTCIPREEDTQLLYHVLAPGAAPGEQLCATPLVHRTGRVQGALVMQLDPQQLTVPFAELMHEIATMFQAGLDNAHRLSIARRDQERLLLLAETADEALWDWNLAKNEVWWGGGIEALFGGGGVLISSRPTWRIERIHPDDAQRVMASLEAALQSTVSSWTGEYRFQRADGRWIHVRDRAWFLREVDGRAYRVIGMLRDVTSLKESLEREQQARAEAERASAVKDEFLAMLGHELRNPLAPIVAALKLFERRDEGLSEKQVQVIERQTQHLVRLVDDLLDISRITRGKIELTRRAVRLEELVARAVEQVGPLIEHRAHKLHLDVADLTLDADPARIAQVLANLIGNAAKYTEPGGNIFVSARRESDRAYIEVRDDGIGMGPELLAHAFETFVQGRQSLDRSQGGLGLGLAIVKNLVQLHGGTVEAHSDGPGLGTTLKLRLPLAKAGAEVAPRESPPRPQAPAPSRALRVLLVDDNEDAAELLGEVLREAGHDVRLAHRGDAALRMLDTFSPDVGVLDIGLPGMSGYELAARLRAKLGTAVRLIALTGYGQGADRQRAIDAGFDAHLVKPVNTDKLEATIRQLTAPKPAKADALR